MNNKQFYSLLLATSAGLALLIVSIYYQILSFNHFEYRMLGLSTQIIDLTPKEVKTTTLPHTEGAKMFANPLLGQLQFEFPETWSSYTKQNVDGTDITTADLGPGQLGECGACGGYTNQADVTIISTSYPAADHAKYPTSLDGVLADVTNNGGTITKRTDKQLANGVLVDLEIKSVPCSEAGCVNIPEVLVYIPKSNTAAKGEIIRIIRNESNSLNDAGWNLIKSTLDFSKK